MSRVTDAAGPLRLSALEGSNPLGFLTALGTLVVLTECGEDPRLAWTSGAAWTPVLHGLSSPDPGRVSALVTEALRGQQAPAVAEQARREAQRAFDAAKKAVQSKKKEIGARGLRGQDRERAMEEELRPLEELRDRCRDEWLAALRRAVPRPELALGRHIDCTPQEFRDHVRMFQEEAGQDRRETLDLLAAFGNDACTTRYGAIQATPFCFVTGSGHQYFLDTVRQLLERVNPERVREALFEPWTYRDHTLSLRWDPIEDRRYALADRNPSDEASRTVWMANLLAYRALVLFPSAPDGSRLLTTAWSEVDREPAFTWPLWEQPAAIEEVRSLVQLRDLASAAPVWASLRARGVAVAYRARRIKVGEGANSKLNFTPARAV